MIYSIIGYFTLVVGQISFLFAQTDLIDPAIEVGGIGLFVTGAAFIVRYILKAVERQQATTDTINARLEAENERLRSRVSELETRIDNRETG